MYMWSNMIHPGNMSTSGILYTVQLTQEKFAKHTLTSISWFRACSFACSSSASDPWASAKYSFDMQSNQSSINEKIRRMKTQHCVYVLLTREVQLNPHIRCTALHAEQTFFLRSSKCILMLKPFINFNNANETSYKQSELWVHAIPTVKLVCLFSVGNRLNIADLNYIPYSFSNC